MAARDAMTGPAGNSRNAPGRQACWCRGRLARGRSGQILAIIILAMAVLVGLIFYVLNLGGQLNRRLRMQNAADASVISGAGWMARSMNLVAMDNMGQARLIALAAVLDALPLAAELAIVELKADQETKDSLAKGLADQLARGVPDGRLEHGMIPSDNLQTTVADAVLFMPADRAASDPNQALIDPAWPLPAEVQARIRSLGTVADDGTGNFAAQGLWRTSDAVNQFGASSLDTLQQGASATWTVNLPAGGAYNVYAWWSADKDGTHRDEQAEFTVFHADGQSVSRQDQNCRWVDTQNVSPSGTWIRLGAYRFAADAQGAVTARVQVRRNAPSGVPQESINFVRTGLEKLRREITPGLQAQYDALQAVDDALNSADEKDPEPGAYPVKDDTWWDTGAGRGRMWQAAQALVDFSQAARTAAPILAQADAVQFGQLNGAQSAFLTPVLPNFPAVEGTFADFMPLLAGHFVVYDDGAELDMTNLPHGIYAIVGRANGIDAQLSQIDSDLDGIDAQLAALAGNDPQRAALEARHDQLLQQRLSLDNDKTGLFASLHRNAPGGGIPDYAYPHRLGPFARLYRWRWPHNIRTGQGPSDPGWHGDPEVGGDRRDGGQTVQVGYVVHGPYQWALDQMAGALGLVGRRMGLADVTRLSYHLARIANIKLAYLAGVTKPQKVHYPLRWITDYDEAKAFAADPANRRKIIRTRYYRPVVLSSLSWDHAGWLADERTFWGVNGHLQPLNDPPVTFWIYEPNGWYDVAVRRPQAQKLMQNIWRWTRQYPASYDHRVHLYTRYDSQTGQVIPWTVYVASWYVFGGIEISTEDVTVANPYNWTAAEKLPYPLLLDRSGGDYDPGADAGGADQGWRRTQFTYLGVARASATAEVWDNPRVPSVWGPRFASLEPTNSMVAVAQAQVFNNRSWDLWTQDWQAQLMPVTQWDDWTSRLADGVGEAGGTEGAVDPGEVEAMHKYFLRIAPAMAEECLKH